MKVRYSPDPVRFCRMTAQEVRDSFLIESLFQPNTVEILYTDVDRAIIGSAAPTIKFVTSACDFVIGKNISSFKTSDCESFAKKVMEYASPISDIRGSAQYRKEVLYNISKSIFENQAAH